MAGTDHETRTQQEARSREVELAPSIDFKSLVGCAPENQGRERSRNLGGLQRSSGLISHLWRTRRVSVMCCVCRKRGQESPRSTTAVCTHRQSPTFVEVTTREKADDANTVGTRRDADTGDCQARARSRDLSETMSCQHLLTRTLGSASLNNRLSKNTRALGACLHTTG